MSRFITHTKNFIAKKIGYKPRRHVVNNNLGKHKLMAIYGTIRDKPDQDDAWFFKLADLYENIVDVGANIGLTALMAKVQHPEKNILLVDPNPEALGIAARNLFINRWEKNVSFLTALISDNRSEKMKFYAVGDGAAGSIFQGHAVTASKMDSYIEVESVLLDDVYKDLAWKPHLIKVDVEGAESMVLTGAKELARQAQPVFMVEMHNPPELPMMKNAGLVLDWCKEVNYTAWYMKDAAILESPETIAKRGKCHLLLMPSGQEYPKELAAIKQGAEIQ